jgi:hypothetical protein
MVSQQPLTTRQPSSSSLQHQQDQLQLQLHQQQQHQQQHQRRSRSVSKLPDNRMATSNVSFRESQPKQRAQCSIRLPSGRSSSALQSSSQHQQQQQQQHYAQLQQYAQHQHQHQHSHSQQQQPQQQVHSHQRPLQQAEAKIDGLLQDLEDLKFFQELDDSSRPNDSPPQKMLGAIKAEQKSNIHRKDYAGGHLVNANDTSNFNVNAAAAPKTPRGAAAAPPKTPRGLELVIRAISPTQGHMRLPPPPKEPLSPRQISKLDRTTLELETQTLCRRVVVLERELVSQNHEAMLQDQSHSAKNIKTLEAQLKQASTDAQVNREQIITDYEGRLQENIQKLQYIQQQADVYRMERDKARVEVEKRSMEYKELKANTLIRRNIKRTAEEAHGHIPFAINQLPTVASF